MQSLPPETMPTVPHIAFWIFNLATPNVIVIGILLAVFSLASWMRLENQSPDSLRRSKTR